MLIVPFFISLGLTPLIKKYSVIAKTYAKENERTIHHGKISRIGGVAIYVSFIISMALFVKADMAVNGMILGGSLMFFAGLIDDLIDIVLYGLCRIILYDNLHIQRSQTVIQAVYRLQYPMG